eukprot:jgi/Tetstr1/432058/TSEL_021529.t1
MHSVASIVANSKIAPPAMLMGVKASKTPKMMAPLVKFGAEARKASGRRQRMTSIAAPHGPPSGKVEAIGGGAVAGGGGWAVAFDISP